MDNMQDSQLGSQFDIEIANNLSANNATRRKTKSKHPIVKPEQMPLKRDGSAFKLETHDYEQTENTHLTNIKHSSLEERHQKDRFSQFLQKQSQFQTRKEQRLQSLIKEKLDNEPKPMRQDLKASVKKSFKALETMDKKERQETKILQPRISRPVNKPAATLKKQAQQKATADIVPKSARQATKGFFEVTINTKPKPGSPGTQHGGNQRKTSQLQTSIALTEEVLNEFPLASSNSVMRPHLPEDPSQLFAGNDVLEELYNELDETQQVIHDYQLQPTFPKTQDQQNWLATPSGFDKGVYIGRNNNVLQSVNQQSAEMYSKVQQDILNYSHRYHSQNSNRGSNETPRHMRLSHPGATKHDPNTVMSQSMVNSAQKIQPEGVIAKNYSVAGMAGRDQIYSENKQPFNKSQNYDIGLLATGQKNRPKQQSVSNLPFDGLATFGSPSTNRYISQPAEIFMLQNPQQKQQQQQIAASKMVQAAKKHLRELQEKRLLTQRRQQMQESRQTRETKKKQQQLDEQYLSNKFTRQFILCANLVLQGREQLSSDTELDFDQFREFAIRFGLLSERQALSDTRERTLLNELWTILARQAPDEISIKILNLKTIVTAMLGFAIMVADSKLPYAGIKATKKRPKVIPDFLNTPKNVLEANSDDGFEQADNIFADDMTERNDQPRDLRIYGQYHSVSKGLNPQLTSVAIERRQTGITSREPVSTSLSHLDESGRNQRKFSFPQQIPQRLVDNAEETEGQDQFSEQYNHQEESGNEGEEAADHSVVQIGFFQEEDDILDNGEYKSPIFCMRKKDVRLVQRRFAPFYLNWKEFLMKDLIVKRIAIGNTETTFRPAINEQSKNMLPENRQKVWERELPRKSKSRQSLSQSSKSPSVNSDLKVVQSDYYQISDFKNMQNFKTQLRQSIDQFSNFAASQHQHVMPGQKKPLTTPKLSDRQNLIYEKGRDKLLTRKDKDKDVLEYEKQVAACTFSPQLPNRNPMRTSKPKDTAAERRKNESIERDIDSRRKAYVQKQIVEAVKTKGGWPRDYASMMETKSNQSEDSSSMRLSQGQSKPKTVRSVIPKRKRDKDQIVDYYQSAKSSSPTNIDVHPQNIFREQQLQESPTSMFDPSRDEQGRPMVASMLNTGMEKPVSLSDLGGNGFVEDPNDLHQHIDKADKALLPNDEQKDHQDVPVTSPLIPSLALPTQEPVQSNQVEEVESVVPSTSRKRPMLLIDVDTGENEKDRIEVFKDDQPAQLAKKFCEKHNYDESTFETLKQMIEERLRKALNKMEAKRHEKKRQLKASRSSNQAD